MALTKVTRGLLTTGIVDNSNATAITIDSSENVGIGTASPDAPVHLLATGLADGILIEGNDNNNVKLRLKNVGASGEEWQMQVGQQGASNAGFHIRSNTSSANRLSIDSSGNVGIGTGSPNTNLHVGSGTTGSGLGILISKGATTNFLVCNDGTKEAYIGTDASNAYVKLGSLSNHPVAISQANGIAMYIDTSKNVGIGTSSITNNTLGKTTYFGNSTSSITGSSSSASFWLGNNWYYNSGDKFIGTGYANLYTQQSGEHQFLTSTASGTAGAAATFTQVLKIDSSGHAIIGGGVTLGNGQTYAAANTLDDYEEGTWTPVTGPVSTTATYAFRSGYYTKVGRLVTCTFGLKHNGGVWTTGQSTISGLPFTIDATGSYQEPMFIVTTLGLAPTGQGGSSASGAFNIGEVSFFCNGGGTVGYGRQFNLNNDTVLAGTSIFATNSFIKATIIYYSS